MKWLRQMFQKPLPPTPQQMVAYLLDKSGDLGSRDDVAKDPYRFDLPEVEAALIEVATDRSEEEMIIDTAGESLWQIWQRQGKTPPPDVLARMHPSARKFFGNDS
jgi:hypothetical protein